MKRIHLLSCFLLFAIGRMVSQADITVIATGLRSPVGIDPDNTGNYFVAQAGTGINDGEVSLMDPNGSMTPLVVDLPSVFDTATNEIVGTFRAQPIADSFFAVFNSIGLDDSGPAIFLFNRNHFLPGSPLTLDDAVSIFEIGKFSWNSGFIESNPYSLVHDGCDWYIADAAANAIVKRNGLTGQYSVFAEFPSFQNPLPFGPPFVHPVPTRIINDPEGGFLVSSLTGFPFVPGASKVWHVDIDGNVSVQDSGYTLVTDIALHRTEGGYLTLKYADFDLMQAPPFVFNSAMIVHTLPNGDRDTIAAGFGPSAGMAIESEEIIYVTEIFQGRVLRIDTETTAVSDPDDEKEDGLILAPNPAHSEVLIRYTVPVGDEVTIKWFDMSGKLIAESILGYKETGIQTENISIDAIPGIHAQPYYVRLEGAKGWSFDKVLVVTK